MIKDQFIIDCALRIAQSRQYRILKNGLQPIDDYDLDGRLQPGLQSKYEQEMLELRDAYASWQAGGDKTQWHVLHEAADVYYYSRQIERQSDKQFWPVVYRSIRLYLPSEWGAEAVKRAAHAKYGWRSEKAGNKSESLEISLMQEAISLKRGPKPKERGEVTRFNFIISQKLKKALEYILAEEIEDDPDLSISEIIERELRKSETVQKFLSSVEGIDA